MPDSAPAITIKALDGRRKNGEKVESCVAGVDRQQIRDASAYVKSIWPVTDGFGGMMQMCQAENYLGKRLCLSGVIKT